MKNLIVFVLAGLLAVFSSVPAASAAMENAASSEAGSTSITVDVSIDPTLAPAPPSASGATGNSEPGDSAPIPSSESSTSENEYRPEQPADSVDSEAQVLPDDGMRPSMKPKHAARKAWSSKKLQKHLPLWSASLRVLIRSCVVTLPMSRPAA